MTEAQWRKSSHSASNECVEVAWRKSTYSQPDECVEVAFALTSVGVRDSKQPEGPRLTFSPETWLKFISG